MIKDKFKTFVKENYFAIVIILLLVVLSGFFMYVGDDWVWGTSIGIKRLSGFFKNYNGRYFSDILIIIISRVNLLRILLTVGVTFGIIYLIPKITGTKKISFPLIFLIILATPTAVFINSIAWASGFVNYVVSAFFVLVFLCLIRKIADSYWEMSGFWKNFGLLILGILSSLIVEHVTIYLVLLIIFLNIYSYFKYKKVSKSLIFYGLGVLSGAVLMFSNEAYLSVIRGDDAYRSSGVSSSFIENIFNAYFYTIFKDFIFNNYVLNIFIVLGLIMVSLKKENRDNRKISILTLFCFVYLIYTILKIINGNWNIIGKYTIYLEGIWTILYCLSILLVILLAKNFNVSQKKKLVFILVSIVTIAAPLLVVKPVTPRCFFPTYIMLILFVVQFYEFCGIFENRIYKKMNSFIITLGFVYYVFWLSICSYNYLNNVRRNIYIKNQIAEGVTTVEIYRLPYEKYIGCDYGSFPEGNALWTDIFKEFYNIDSNVDIIMTNKSRAQIEK